MSRKNMRRPVKSKSSIVYGGFDLSLTSSGIVFLDGNGKRIYSTSLNFKTKDAQRLSDIYSSVRRLCMRAKPTLVCIEGYSVGSQFNREVMGELGGVIRMLLFEMSIPFVIVQPTSLKKFVLGKGVGAKDQIMLHVYKQWGFTAKTNDEADAYGLAKIAQALHDENSVKLDSDQQAALEEVGMSKAEKAARKKQLKLEKAERKAAREAKRR